MQASSVDREKANFKSGSRKETEEEMGLARQRKALMRRQGGAQKSQRRVWKVNH